MMKNVLMVTGEAISSYIKSETAGKDTMKTTTQSWTVIWLSGREKPVILNRVLYVPDSELRLVSVSSLSYGHCFIQFTSKKPVA